MRMSCNFLFFDIDANFCGINVNQLNYRTDILKVLLKLNEAYRIQIFRRKNGRWKAVDERRRSSHDMDPGGGKRSGWDVKLDLKGEYKIHSHQLYSVSKVIKLVSEYLHFCRRQELFCHI